MYVIYFCLDLQKWLIHGITVALDREAILLMDINVDFSSSKNLANSEFLFPRSSSAT